MPQTRTFLNDIVSSPVNLALVALICYFSYKLIARTFAKAPSASDPKHRKIEKMPRRDFTLAELREYDGLRRDDGRILVGVLGKVFDMSAGATFYGPGGPYSVFAGRDASRALATFSVDAKLFKDEDDDLSDLTSSELSNVKEWEQQFLEKYPVVGKLLKSGEQPTNYNEVLENEVASKLNAISTAISSKSSSGSGAGDASSEENKKEL